MDRRGGQGVLGGIASSESQARPFTGTVCAVPGLRETPLKPLTGGVTEPGLGDGVLGLHSQTVHPKGVLSGWVGQDHVRVIEHVQSVQSQGVNLEFVQGKLAVRVEADIADPSQCAGQFFREAGRGLSCHCENDVGDAAVAGIAQLLCVWQAPMAACQAHHGRLRVVECRAWAVQTAGADGSLHHVELFQLVGQSIGLPGCHLLLIVRVPKHAAQVGRVLWGAPRGEALIGDR